MKIRYAHLCDHTVISRDLKPTIIGIFNRIWSKNMPFTYGKAAILFVCLCVENEDCGSSHKLKMALVDPEGHEILVIEGEANVDAKQKPGDVFLDWTLSNLAFAEPGPHIFQISVDGKLDFAIDFMVELRA